MSHTVKMTGDTRYKTKQAGLSFSSQQIGPHNYSVWYVFKAMILLVTLMSIFIIFN